jgi:hypothetical protein
MACKACAKEKFIMIGAQYVIWKRYKQPSIWKPLSKCYREDCIRIQMLCESNAKRFMNEKCPECPKEKV